MEKLKVGHGEEELYCRYEGDEQVSGRVQSGRDPQTGTGHVRNGERREGTWSQEN